MHGSIKNFLSEPLVQAARPSVDLHVSSLAPQGAACLARQLLRFPTPGPQLAQPPPAPSRGRVCPRIRQALCPEGLQLLWGAGGQKSKRRRSSAKQFGRWKGRKANTVSLQRNSKCLPFSDLSPWAWLSMLCRGRIRE